MMMIRDFHRHGRRRTPESAVTPSFRLPGKLYPKLRSQRDGQWLSAVQAVTTGIIQTLSTGHSLVRLCCAAASEETAADRTTTWDRKSLLLSIHGDSSPIHSTGSALLVFRTPQPSGIFILRCGSMIPRLRIMFLFLIRVSLIMSIALIIR